MLLATVQRSGARRWGVGVSCLLHTERHRSGPVLACGEPSFPSHSVPQRKRPRSYWNTPTSDLPRASLFEAQSYFLLGPVGTLTEGQ